jgi:GNAT superfamily N-acetyltransferase
VPDRAAFDTALLEVLAGGDSYLIVAEVDAKVVGYLLGFDHPTFFANGRVSWVDELAVHSAFRSQGIGRALMAEFEIWATSRRSRIIALATRRAAPFYDALGYEDSAAYFRKLL